MSFNTIQSSYQPGFSSFSYSLPAFFILLTLCDSWAQVSFTPKCVFEFYPFVWNYLPAFLLMLLAIYHNQPGYNLLCLVPLNSSLSSSFHVLHFLLLLYLSHTVIVCLYPLIHLYSPIHSRYSTYICWMKEFLLPYKLHITKCISILIQKVSF